MRCKLLKKLRRIGRDKIDVHSVTTTNGVVTGVSYGYTGKEYSDIWSRGMTERDMREKAARIYIESQLPVLRKKFKHTTP